MCLYPSLITNPKYKPNRKNGGTPPPCSDLRTKYVPIGCGNCIECRKQKKREWQIRLLEEIRHDNNGKFITLTFSNESIKKLNEQQITKCKKTLQYNPYIEEYESITTKHKIDIKQLEGYSKDNAIATKAVRLFLERYRKLYKHSLKHWLVTELGHEGTQNIHIHGIIWIDKHKDVALENLAKIWQYGHVWIGKETPHNKKLINYVNEKTVNYITKYVNKIDTLHKNYKSIILTSAGIGNNYTKRPDSQRNKFNGEKTIETYRTRSGHKMSLPIYYRNKIYSEQEREQLWIIKLNKQTRYVLGNKIDISKTPQEYIEALEYARKRNREMKYGELKKDYNQMEYEKRLRDIMQTTRMKNAMFKPRRQGSLLEY